MDSGVTERNGVENSEEEGSDDVPSSTLSSRSHSSHQCTTLRGVRPNGRLKRRNRMSWRSS
jgi:hypothetical protein